MSERLLNALRLAQEALLAERTPDGMWEGRLSSSALSTATAVVALELSQRAGLVADELHQSLVDRGLNWLATHANTDGGWGDTVSSQSNLSTTTLVWAAFRIRPDLSSRHASSVQAAEEWLSRRVGALNPERLAGAILERYASDRTFSVPILTHCALCGVLGVGTAAWDRVIPLPFELSVFPPSWYAALQLPVVSYALPALIAVGYARHAHAPSGNPLARGLRALASRRALRLLNTLQPPNGGFLEATPLTSFVLMSLVSSGEALHPVAGRALKFLASSVRPDGSWPIDTHLATWVSTLSIQALSSGHSASFPLETEARRDMVEWLLKQQYTRRHPYTNAAPGGWAWTPLPGGVPDADDTAGALLALKTLDVNTPEVREAVAAGAGWLMDLQNRDGGIPTFCHGWGTLPFDRSSADITAHALRAWKAWEQQLPVQLQNRLVASVKRATAFLTRTQEPSGAWCPLWFGNEHESDESNRVYGTSRVLLALSEVGLCPDASQRAAQWLRSAQKADGGWGGGLGEAPSSIEETGLAVEALAAWVEKNPEIREAVIPSILRGAEWLAGRVENGEWRSPSPIGFYFAKLWYYEELYPMIFCTAALGRAQRMLTLSNAAHRPR